jgi:hypothetical protein
MSAPPKRDPLATATTGIDLAGGAAASSEPAGFEARVAVHYGGVWRELPEGETIVGRGEEAGLAIESPGVSRRHAKICVLPGRVTIEDLGSRNGTFVDERQIDSLLEITQSVSIRVGPVLFMLQCGEEQQ